MNNTGVIDHFLEVFTRYIDSGFGLLSGEVAFIASTLIAIDMALAGIFWTLEAGGENELIARLIKKTLFIGAFAYLISNWNALSSIIFHSFAGLGLKATGSGFSISDLMRPGKLAQTGLDAGQPLLQSASDLMGAVSFFENFLQIICLMLAWVLIVLAFFILAIQMFVTLIEFKLTTLAGFVLIPFGLFGKSAFLAERVLGNVISSGIKVLVLAVILGIGSTLFSSLVQDFGSDSPTIEEAMSIVLASLTLLGLGIFGPGIANGLVSGGPQLGAGAAVGTAIAAGGVGVAGAAGVGMMMRSVGALGGAVASTVQTGARVAGAASTAYGLGAAGKEGGSAIAGGLANVAKTAANRASTPIGSAIGSAQEKTAESVKEGSRQAFAANGGATTKDQTSGDTQSHPASSPNPGEEMTEGGSEPQWAKSLRDQQHLMHGVNALTSTIRSGDAKGGGASPDLSDNS
jgi:type IV secretion system protein TrbL